MTKQKNPKQYQMSDFRKNRPNNSIKQYKIAFWLQNSIILLKQYIVAALIIAIDLSGLAGVMPNRMRTKRNVCNKRSNKRGGQLLVTRPFHWT